MVKSLQFITETLVVINLTAMIAKSRKELQIMDFSSLRFSVLFMRTLRLKRIKLIKLFGNDHPF